MAESASNGATMRTVETLLDEAIKHAGSATKLAALIGCHPPDVHNMKNGSRAISPATVGLLCDVLELSGEEARRLAALAIVATAKPEKAQALRRAFFVSLALGAVVTLHHFVIPTNDAMALMGEGRDSAIYTSCAVIALVLGLLAGPCGARLSRFGHRF